MTNRDQKKVRLVKCPKCSRILPEPEQVPLYTCGGCGTILQAKYYKRDKEGAVLTTRPEEVPNHGVGHSLEVEKSSGSSSSGEQQTARNGKKGEKAVENCDSEQIGAENPAHPISLEQTSVLKNKEERLVLGLERQLAETADQKVYQFSSEVEATAQKRALLLAASSSSGVSSVKDHIVGRNKDAQNLPMELDTTEKNNGQDESDDIADENLDHKKIYTSEIHTRREFEVLGNKEPQNEDNQRDLRDDMSSDKQEDAALEDPVNEVSMSIKSRTTETAMQFAPRNLAEGSSSDHETKKMNLAVEDSSKDARKQINSLEADKPIADAKLLKEGGRGEEQNQSVECIKEELVSVILSSEDPSANSLVGAEGSLGARGSYSMPSATDLKSVSEESVSPENEYRIKSGNNVRETTRQKTENSDNPAVSGSELGRSSGKSESLELVDVQEELSPSCEAVLRSPTKVSLAYDGSVSSCDGNDDQVPGLPMQDCSEASLGNGVADFTKKSSEWNNVPTRRIPYGNARTGARVKISSSLPLDELLRSSVIEEDESVRRNGIRESDRSRVSKNVFPPKIPFYRRSSEVTFETGSSSGYVRDDPATHWAHNHPYINEENRAYMPRGYMERSRIPEAGWRKSDFPPMQYHDVIAGEMYHTPRYQGYADRRRRADSWSLSGSLPQTRYSGEVFNGKYQFHDPYMHRRPDNLRWSVQLPPSAAYYRQGPVSYMAPSREISSYPYDSYPMSPPRYMDTEPYAWAQDRAYLSDDQRHKDQIMQRLYPRENRQVVKRHLRPVASGAPFITCYFCYKVLQLPEDFLISKRRRKHRLKCGSCLSNLEFSLENETCLAPSIPHIDESTATFVERAVGSASSAHVNHSHGNNLVSGEAHPNGRSVLEHNSFGALGREKSKLMSTNASNGESRDESYNAEPAPPTAQSKQVKVTWQFPARTKSPLHRLMGYSSPEDLLTAKTAIDVEELESHRVTR